jgi:hypothetical protein
VSKWRFYKTAEKVDSFVRPIKKERAACKMICTDRPGLQ